MAFQKVVTADDDCIGKLHVFHSMHNSFQFIATILKTFKLIYSADHGFHLQVQDMQM